MPFHKGQSGNPGGHKPDKYLRELCRAETNRCLETLIALRDGKKVPAAVRRQAAVDILDRGWGRPLQAIGGQDGGPIHIADGRAKLAHLIAAQAASSGAGEDTQSA